MSNGAPKEASVRKFPGVSFPTPERKSVFLPQVESRALRRDFYLDLPRGETLTISKREIRAEVDRFLAETKVKKYA
jgi:hypothetical protein